MGFFLKKKELIFNGDNKCLKKWLIESFIFFNFFSNFRRERAICHQTQSQKNLFKICAVSERVLERKREEKLVAGSLI